MDAEGSLSEAGYLVATLEAAVSFITQVLIRVYPFTEGGLLSLATEHGVVFHDLRPVDAFSCVFPSSTGNCRECLRAQCGCYLLFIACVRGAGALAKTCIFAVSPVLLAVVDKLL